MKTLFYGDRGTTVSYLQLALARAGYPVEIDGYFGTQTYDSLENFLQNRFSGEVNGAVWGELLPYLKGYTTYQEQSGDMRVIPFDFPVVPTGVPYSSELLELVIEGLLVRYPFITEENIGKSVMGKNLKALRLGTGAREVFYNAAFHANEWITTPVLLKFAEEYAKSYAAGESLAGIETAEFFETFSIYLVPMVNPDGVDLVNGLLSRGAFYELAREIAGNYPRIPFPEGWKANIAGVDLNLQFPAGWENAREIKFQMGYTSPAPRDYVGEAPLTAPESLAVYDFTLAHDFELILAYHSQGEVIYWKYLDYDPPKAAEIAAYFGEVSGYEVSETPAESGYAGYKDWFIMNYNRPGYTIEVGSGENPLPLSQFDQIYSDNLPILTGAVKELQELCKITDA